MTDLVEQSQFDTVYQLETTDKVLAGPGGIANRQAQQLANRTKWLKDQLDALVSGAPGALDTLNELAAALGDDANFASTVTNALATKASLDHVDKYRQSTTVDFASDAQLDLTADASQEFGIILMTDTGGVLTAQQNVLMSSTQRDFVVYNNTAQTLIFKTSGGTGIDVPSNSFDLLRCDGANITRQLMAPA
ncbi:hypothetical protein P8629_02850, partial [Hydrogenovibrio sp. 3SP14C1]|uniref:hypothetical protein n=1 Tax=Hydrogenovibrio sp. 3SP14C1 TaxID=3038774 RepID=UPI002417FC14